MQHRTGIAVAAAALAALALAACSSTASDDAPADPASTGTDAPTDAFTLETTETDLGTIVVDGDGAVVYQFDSDEQGSGSSTCEGNCADMWPAVPGSDDVQLDGVTGEVGTITGVDGEPQLTLDGWPLYYFAQDAEPGDTLGQGVMDVWWVVDPTGTPIR
ncbi:COG4315 family predicted lipoprotein [Agrococcus sp. SGAir0287]|uniref:COG4315 family predicted lipoprotein n=1 Tax=Agrococcus sp. SGAir0287 TaxID=2070347 RepID=UPI0010CCC833|nr:hypothetical protein [Agrococcus sp. SGAir0287]QCR19190.1 hypothetical protein C1N71_06885 [Agrococcus sp. SGAir0287]